MNGGTQYRIALYVGTVAGTFSGAAAAASRGVDPSTFALLTVALLVPALIGARGLYVLTRRAIYQEDVRRIWRRSGGGAALFGGLAVGVVVSAPVLISLGIPFWRFWDAATVTMLVGLIFTRFGCLANGCCGGRPTKRRIGVWMRNVDGEWARRYPTQLIDVAVATVLLALVALLWDQDASEGTAFVTVTALYSATRAATAGLRERRSHQPASLM